MQFCLGIDVGSSSVKIVLVNCSTKCVVVESVNLHNADVKSESPKFNEQNVAKIFECVEKCMSELERKCLEFLSQVKCIAVCGQMHGCVLWQSSDIVKPQNAKRNLIQCVAENEVPVSNLITWQDQRADETFIQSLPKPESHMSIHSGYGCVTLMWLKVHSSNSLRELDCAATVADFLVSLLCKLPKPVMNLQNAASWGYCDTDKCCWNMSLLKNVDFPTLLLPQIGDPSQPAGRTKSGWHSIPEGTPVLCALGDFQCSVFANLRENSAILNIGTSAQLTYQMPEKFIPHQIHQNYPSSVAYFPYFNRRYLAVAASLNGGNILDRFVKVLTNWTSEISGTKISEAQVWSKLLNDRQIQPLTVNFVVKPTLFGERHQPSVGFSIENILASDGLNLFAFTGKLSESIVENLNEMLPKKLLEENGVNRLILTGQACKPHFKGCIEKMYGSFQIVADEGCVADAAVGCALFACNYLLSV